MQLSLSCCLHKLTKPYIMQGPALQPNLAELYSAQFSLPSVGEL